MSHEFISSPHQGIASVRCRIVPLFHYRSISSPQCRINSSVRRSAVSISWRIVAALAKCFIAMPHQSIAQLPSVQHIPFIPHAPNCQDHLRLAGIVLDLHPQSANINGQRAVIDIIIFTIPKPIQYLRLRQHDIRIFHEQAQQLIFRCGQIQ